MVIKTIDASLVQKCFLAGANAMDAKKEMINDLNVFPVPDGDTGTNMTMTIMSAAREVSALDGTDMKKLCKAISSGSLRGARGNSGVILSQLLRGFTKEISKVEEVDVEILSKAFERAVESAYKAVMKPKEGTILTVARAGSDKALELSGRTDNLLEFMNKILMHMRDVLDQTPEMLPVLKQAGVVDSGGEGLLTMIEGAYDALLGKEVSTEISSLSSGSAAPGGARADVVAETEIHFGYCTEFIIMLEKNFGKKEEKEVKDYLTSIGDSLVCVADDDIVKIHVHTNDPGLAIQKGLSYGSLTSMKIDNMREEHNERVIKGTQKRDGDAAGEETAENRPEETERKQNGFISVSVGDGLCRIFGDLGVDFVIEGGQTMNPSTEDILDAIGRVNADHIFVLPNNSNIILAAEQAKDLTEDKEIFVIPTKNIPQGIAAMISFSDALSPEENAETMAESAGAVRSGQVTYAVRDTVIDGREIKSGDIMGLSDKTIEVVGESAVSVTLNLIRKMLDDDSELVTIYYGEEGSEEDAVRISQAIQEESDAEVEIQYGGQPIYYYFVSVE